MKRHAYLILAHNEYEILQEIVSALDFSDNDIYIHIDAKISILPSLTTFAAGLHILENRIKVYWGCVDLVMAETLLLKSAYSSGIKYEYYHIISGIHYPLKSHDELREFFNSISGKSVLQPMYETFESVQKRLGRYHLFLRNYYSPNKIKRKLFKYQWLIGLRLQKLLGISRDISYFGGKASNWCSLTHDAVEKWVKDENKIKKRFRMTLCADEYVAMSVIKEHNLPYIECDSLLYLEFVQGNPKFLSDEDYEAVKHSDALFGRKFTKNSLSLIEKLKNGVDKNICNKS